MAAVDAVDLVSIDEGKRTRGMLSDKVLFFPSELEKPGRRTQTYTLHAFRSWALDIVPRLARQREGKLIPGERQIRVILYNGKDHYDAAVCV